MPPPAEGQDALIVAYEDDRYVVVAGTFDKLVEQLACEEKPGQPNHTCTHTHTHHVTNYLCVPHVYILCVKGSILYYVLSFILHPPPPPPRPSLCAHLPVWLPALLSCL